MKYGKLKDVTGEFVHESYDWLKTEDCGCCSVCFAQDRKHDYVVCIGWHDYGDGYEVAWKIGRQAHENVMQCDFDLDFEMPYNEETGDVDDTIETITVSDRKPVGYKSWDELAEVIRDEADRVWNDWKEVEE